MPERKLAWEDTFVQALVQSVVGDTCEGSPILLDNSYNYIALELTADEWTKLFSCILTGGDLVYPDESHQILWSFLKGVECAMAFCEKVRNCLDGTDDAGIRLFMASQGYLPIGAIYPYLGFNPPFGSLDCLGQTLERASYPILYDVIDPAFHVDADHFYLPDLQNMFLLGEGENSIGATGGEKEHILVTGEIPSHNHQYTRPNANTFLADVGAGSVVGTVSGNIGTTNTGGGGAHNNMPPFMVVRYCIVAF